MLRLRRSDRSARRRDIALGAALALTAALLLAAPSTARARSSADGRPARPWLVSVALGPTFALGPELSQAKLEQHLALRLTELGLQVGGVLQESFVVGAVVLQLGIRIGWALRPFDSLTLRVVPFGQIGYAAIYFSGPFGLGGWAQRFDLQLGAELRQPLTTTWYLLLRPVALEIQADDDGGKVRYDLLGGCGLRF